MNWDMYQNTYGSFGSTRRERIINRNHDMIKSTITHSPDYKIVKIPNHPNITELVVHTTETETVKNWNTMPGDALLLGDLVFLQGKCWMIIKIDSDDDMVMSGEMERCNQVITFQNKHTHQIVKKWCVISRPYSSAVNKDYEIITSKREFKVKIPWDNDTNLVDVDDRFLLEVIDGEPKSYHITSVDQMTYQFDGDEGGYIVWSLVQDTAYTPTTDRIDLMIADYVEPSGTNDGSNSEEYGEILYRGLPQVRVGSSKKLTALFYNNNGIAEDSNTYTWGVSAKDDSLVDQFQLINDGTSATLKVANDANIGNKEITVSCTNAAGTVAEIQLKVVVGF